MGVYTININVNGGQGGQGQGQGGGSGSDSGFGSSDILTTEGLIASRYSPPGGNRAEREIVEQIWDPKGKKYVSTDEVFSQIQTQPGIYKRGLFRNTRAELITSTERQRDYWLTANNKLKTGKWETVDQQTEQFSTFTEWNKAGTIYAAHLAAKVARTAVQNVVKYQNATATSAAERNAVLAIDNTSSVMGDITSIGMSAYVGFKVGGPWGAAIGAAVGVGAAVINKSVEYDLMWYRQAVETTGSAEQMKVLGDATYGRSRGIK